MAEPLLKRTFSRLRGKDRTRRKTEPKISEVLQKSSSSSSSSMTRTLPAADPDPLLPPQNHIPVGKKQVWAWQGFSAPSPSLQSGSTPRNCNRISQDASVQAWSQRSAQDKTHQCKDRKWVSQSSDTAGTPCVPVSSTLVPAEEPHPPEASPDPTVSSKSSDQHAYLQSLDRTSRAWVLSSGKTQTLDQAGFQQESSNIWYNPIPEEEDAGGPCREREIWRKRDERKEGGAACTTELGGLLGSTECSSGDFSLDEINLSVSNHNDDINTENPDIIPAPPKKEGVSGSVIDRLKSPGTVRKLSLKMKKLPELRRKLSLRSSSRSQLQGLDRGGDELTSKTSSSVADQNVISRYHLDSSAPPARPLRRSSRGRSAKGGYLSDGDSPELLPRKQAPPVPTLQDMAVNVSEFRLYEGSNLARSSQRVTGLLTVHLLGLEEMKTSRSEGHKEVFLAIQIDGVTRARTSLLTLRGSTLPLNHTFHLELERAWLLRTVVLTPVRPAASSGSKSGMDQTLATPPRNRVCGLGGVSIPPIFKGSRSQQLCVKLEPRGLLYVKLSLQEKWDTQDRARAQLRHADMWRGCRESIYFAQIS